MKHKKLKHSPDQAALGFSVGEMTRLPASEWTAPRIADLPDRLYGAIGLDTECCDYGLQNDVGSGWAWHGGGYVCGYSIAADNWRGYIPLRHEGGDNVEDPVQARGWLQQVLMDETQPKIFANAQFDVGWAKRDGIEIRGPCVDVQWAEALLDEYRKEYSLDAIARDRIGRTKNEDLLRRAAAAHGYHPKKDIHRLPARFVGPYAADDADLPREVWRAQEPLIDEQSLRGVFQLEHDLLPMYIDMRWRGVRIDVSYAEQLQVQLQARIDEIAAQVKRDYGRAVSPWAAKDVAKVLEAEGVVLPRTTNGGPSVTQEILERSSHPFAATVLEWRKRDKLKGTFVEGQILNQLHRGRIHAEIHPLKSDDGGTVTGRLSMSNPNPQFIPKRTEEGKLIRKLFVGEEGEKWCSADYSQQEPRLLVHYAYLAEMPGAAAARQRYISEPDMSYHKFAAELMGLSDYAVAKILNLAIIYGRGVRETANQLQISEAECKRKFEDHAREMPFARALSNLCKSVTQNRGYITSLSGRRMRFPFWEPADWEKRQKVLLDREAAEKHWPGERLVRARIHKALNSLIQPSAADQTKMAMLAVWRSPHRHRVLIQVHDELGCSVPDRQVAEEIGQIMVDAVKLEVPVAVGIDVGPNWKESDA